MLTRTQSAEDVLSRAFALILAHAEEPHGTLHSIREIAQGINKLRRMRKPELLEMARSQGRGATAEHTKEQIVRMLIGDTEQ